jgi:hypothetical protein
LEAASCPVAFRCRSLARFSRNFVVCFQVGSAADHAAVDGADKRLNIRHDVHIRPTDVISVVFLLRNEFSIYLNPAFSCHRFVSFVEKVQLFWRKITTALSIGRILSKN